MEETRIEKLEYLKKSIAQYTTDARLMAVYPDIDIASEQTGIDVEDIARCVSGEKKNVKNFVFMQYDYTISPKKIAEIIAKRMEKLHSSSGYKHKLKGSSIEQYDLEGKFIDSYSSVTSAAQVNGLTQSSISLVINGKQHTSGGFIFLRFFEESDERKAIILQNRLDAYRTHKVGKSSKQDVDVQRKVMDFASSKKMKDSKPGRKKLANILYFDSYGEYIEEFKNPQEVFHRLGLSLTTVRNLCEGKSKSFAEGVLLLKNDYDSFEDAEDAALDRLKAKRKRYAGRKGKKIAQFDKSGRYIDAFNSAKEASDELDISYVRLNQALNGHTRIVDGFVFIYSDMFDSIEAMTREVLYRMTLSREDLRQHIITLNQY